MAANKSIYIIGMICLTVALGCSNKKEEAKALQNDTVAKTEDNVSPVTIVHDELPDSAELADETSKRAIYTKVEKKATEGESANTVSVWIKDKTSGHATRLFTTQPLSKPLWEQMKDCKPVDVALEDIAAADIVCFIPFDTSKILVEGCPDARNIWTYIVDLRTKTAKQFCSSEGLILFNEDDKTIVLGSYDYHEEGGRYSIARTFTIDGTLVNEKVLGDE